MHLYGKRPVMERLRAHPQTLRSLYLEENFNDRELIQLAKAAKRPYAFIPRAAWAKRVGPGNPQGVMAEVDPFGYADFEQLLKPSESRPTLFFLDRITDPQNLGNILRTLACLGNAAVILPKHDSVEVTETVLRVACGGENHVPIARVTNLAQAAESAKKAGFWMMGTAVSGGRALYEVEWPWPVAVVLGSEGSGIRPGLAKQMELTVTLPMPGAGLSFNVATATALIAYEITRCRLLKT